MANRLTSGMIVGLVVIFAFVQAQELEHSKINFWNGTTFHQKTVDTSKQNEGIIRAKTYGKGHQWEEFKLRELPDKFLEWNIKSRTENLKKIKTGEFPSLAGPHNAMVATQGIRRLDTRFKINNAVKGMGFVPKKDKLKETIKLLKSTINKDKQEKLDILASLYNKADEVFDRTKQISLELYSTPEFESHTFLNQMFNPRTAIVFLDIPCFELKVISQLLHPEDPELSQYEKDMVEYANLIHSYFHGKFDKIFIATIYHIIEVYDNSPGKKGRGIRIVPAKQ